MDNLSKIQNGQYNQIRKNDASRWVANDILRKGNNYRSYDMLPGVTDSSISQNAYGQQYVKLPSEIHNNLDSN